MDYAEAVLQVCDENADAIARVLRVLRLVDDSRDWLAEVAAAAESYEPFQARGLSVSALMTTVAGLV